MGVIWELGLDSAYGDRVITRTAWFANQFEICTPTFQQTILYQFFQVVSKCFSSSPKLPTTLVVRVSLSLGLLVETQHWHQLDVRNASESNGTTCTRRYKHIALICKRKEWMAAPLSTCVPLVAYR